jgi:iron complex outermembrane receptor protein
MILRGAVVAAVVCSAAVARADDEPIVEIADLPPLPPPDESAEAAEAALLAASAVEEDVVVGAGKREQSLGNVASAVTVISGDRLRRFGYRTVGEAIRSVAGVFVADDRMVDRVGIRGLQVLGDFNTRILVLVDGATVNEPWAQFAGVGWDAPIAIDDVARIEVIRGPVSSLYGTNAFFGIVNIVTRGAAEQPRAWGRISGTQFAGGAAAAGFSVGDLRRQVRGSVAGTYRGGETLDVAQIGDDLESDAVEGLNASLVGAWGGAFAQARAYRRVRSLPFAPYGTVPDERNHNVDEQVLVEGGYTRAVRHDLAVTARAYASHYRFEDQLVYDPDPIFRDVGVATWTGVELRGRWDALDRGRLGVTAGGELAYADTESRSGAEGEDGVRVPKALDIEGIYAELDGQPLSWLGFSAGVRFDRNSLFENRFSPRAALFVDRGDRYGAKLLYAEGFRNPSPFEGYFDDDDAFEANPDLGAEVIRSYEAVLWARPSPGVSVRLSAFAWNADELVEQELDEATGFLQFRNVGTLRSRGVEAEGSWRDVRGWLAFGGLAYTRVDDGDGGDIAGAPAIVASGGASTPLLWKRVHVSTELQVIGPRPTRDPMVEERAFVGWNLVAYAPDVHGFDLTIGVRNLIGRRERVPAPEDYDRTDELGDPVIVPVLPGEGRELHARIGRRF